MVTKKQFGYKGIVIKSKKKGKKVTEKGKKVTEKGKKVTLTSQNHCYQYVSEDLKTVIKFKKK